MNAEELMREWPGIDKANALRFLDSQAWRVNLELDGSPAVLRSGGIVPESDVLNLQLRIDGVETVLGLCDSICYPDLHRLWSRRGSLPQEVLLALVEKECGGLLQLLENQFRQEIVLVGTVVGCAEERRSFVLQFSGMDMPFMLALSPVQALAWGRVRNIDTGNPEIRAMTRPAFAEYAVFDLVSDELERIKPGAALLLPDGASGNWRLQRSEDDLLHVYAKSASELTFAQIADEDLPPVPGLGSDQLVLVRNGNPVACGVLCRVGCREAVEITTLER